MSPRPITAFAAPLARSLNLRPKHKQLAVGLLSFLPALSELNSKGAGGTLSARYCYTVWLRHLVLAHRHGLLSGPPRTLAELGPGDSVGTGLAALLSGTERYVGMDIVEHADLTAGIPLLDALVGLFRARAPIPNQEEFAEVKPKLDDWSFPHHLLPSERLDAALAPARVERLRRALERPDGPGSPIHYVSPWHDASVAEPESVDMILSQAVLEHVDDLPGTYRAMREWLVPGGVISHQVDFRCHSTHDEWNGHWTYDDLRWRMIRGRRPYLINREPCGTHLALAQGAGFGIGAIIRSHTPSRLTRERLAPRYRSMDLEDLVTSGVFLQARKPS